jgi:hypothetical protein
MQAAILAFAPVVLLTSGAGAAESRQFPFFHHDWEIACDNTRTCRAAGYKADEAEHGESALPKATHLEWTANGKSWRISLKGVNAVLLKMDEFQERLDTRGALIRKGQKPESRFCLPYPFPRSRQPVSSATKARRT